MTPRAVLLPLLAVWVTGCGPTEGSPEDEDDTPADVPPGATEETVVVNGSRAASGSCRFDVEYELSPRISTVGVVRWSTTFDEPTAAHLEFGLPDSEERWVAPVDVRGDEHRTLLLGMKAAHRYEFRIVVSDGDTECVSRDFPITTGELPNSIPRITREVYDGQQAQRGFIITSTGVGNLFGGPSGDPVFILDSDGDVVWYWLDTPPQTSRARMDWAGSRMWMLALNVTRGAGEVSYVSMDGGDHVENVRGLEETHHDFTVLPDGTVTAIAHIGDCSGIIERRPDGTVETIVETVASIYKPGRAVYVTVGGVECHPNSIHYHPEDDSYTISDRYVHAYVKISRSGELLWQLGGHDPLGPSFHAVWAVNHGHEVLDNGNFLLFSNGNAGETARVLEYELDESSWEAERVWEYDGNLTSPTLGDVQRLPGGHTLVTYSNAGVIQEIDRDGEIVQEIKTSSLGYTNFRSSLYGPPLR